MPKLSSGDLKVLLAAEKADAMSAMAASKLSEERSRALDYYLGDMTRDLPAPEGRSRAVSTDVSDTIEGMMPSLVDIFTAGDEVVKFDPVSAEDVAAAEQETDYVNHVFMQKNPGFLILYSFFKDALLSKTGIVKVWWECKDERERETYLDQPADAFALIVADPEVEVEEHSEHPAGVDADAEKLSKESVDYTDQGSPNEHCAMCSHYIDSTSPDAETSADSVMACDLVEGEIAPIGWCNRFMAAPPGMPPRPMLHDVTLVTKRRYECARVEGVPPEEFGIARNARSIADADYCFHEVIRSQGKLIEQGYDAEQIKNLPSYVASTSIEEQARDTVEESRVGGGDNLNDASRLVKITEHYVRLAYEDEDDIRLYRVTTGGDDGDVLLRDGDDDVIEEDVIPFAAITPVIITHRFFGRSIADLVMDIQRIKTALVRGLLDNTYLRNNPRTEVSEAHVTSDSLDDLLVSRPGGLIRMKLPGGLREVVHPDVASTIYPALQYFDTIREQRAGVSRQGQGVDANALQNQVATIANQMLDAAQAKVRLIARIFAETGVRDLFSLLHGCIRKHGSQPQTVRLRNKWVQVDPRDWKKRNDMTINVGLGTGSKGEQLAGTQILINMQKEAIAAGMVSKKNLFASAKVMTKLLGHKDPEEFFIAPGSPVDPNDPDSAPIPPPPDPKQAMAEQKVAEAKERIELEKQKAQADVALNAQKNQADQASSASKITAEAQIRTAQAVEDAKLKREQAAADAQTKREQMAAEAQLRREQATADFNLKVEQMRAEFDLRREELVAEAQLRREQMILDAQVQREIGHVNASVKKSVALSNVEPGGEPG